MTVRSKYDEDTPCPPEVSEATYARIEKELADISKQHAEAMARIGNEYIPHIINAISNINDGGVKHVAIRDILKDRYTPVMLRRLGL